LEDLWWGFALSFFVDPFGLIFIGAILFIISTNYNFARSLVYTLASAILTSFIFGGAALYLDWYRWVIPGLVDVKGSHIMFDQGLTGITKDSFPAWMAMMFLALYPFWFALGYETAKKNKLSIKFVPIFIVGVLLLTIPSIIQSQFHLA
jgi:hypothetical protein